MKENSYKDKAFRSHVVSIIIGKPKCREAVALVCHSMLNTFKLLCSTYKWQNLDTDPHLLKPSKDTGDLPGC